MKAYFENEKLITNISRYVTRDGHDILAHVLIHKSRPTGPRPVLVNWHGGYLIEANGIYEDYFSPFVTDAAEKYGAILVSPDYTLIPSKNGAKDVEDDILAFHSWLSSGLGPLLAKHNVEIDIQKLMVTGGSAGGYASLYHALAFPNEIKALSLLYPMIDFDTEWWRKGPRALGLPNPMHAPDSIFPSDEELSKRIDGSRKGPRVSYGEQDRFGFGPTIVRAGRFLDVFNPDGKHDNSPTLWLNRRVEAGAKLPSRIWLLHGSGDTGVPIDTSERFAETMEKQGRPIRFDNIEGKEHGFDDTASEGFEGPKDPVIVNAVSWLAETWLA